LEELLNLGNAEEKMQVNRGESKPAVNKSRANTCDDLAWRGKMPELDWGRRGSSDKSRGWAIPVWLRKRDVTMCLAGSAGLEPSNWRKVTGHVP